MLFPSMCRTLTWYGKQMPEPSVVADEHKILLTARKQRSLGDLVLPVGAEQVVPNRHEQPKVEVKVVMMACVRW